MTYSFFFIVDVFNAPSFKFMDENSHLFYYDDIAKRKPFDPNIFAGQFYTIKNTKEIVYLDTVSTSYGLYSRTYWSFHDLEFHDFGKVAREEIGDLESDNCDVKIGEISESIQQDEIAVILLCLSGHPSLETATSSIFELCNSHGLNVKVTLMNTSKVAFAEWAKQYKRILFESKDCIILVTHSYRKNSIKAREEAIKDFYSFLEDEEAVI